MNIPLPELEKIIIEEVKKFLGTKEIAQPPESQLKSPPETPPHVSSSEGIAVILFGGTGGVPQFCELLKNQVKKNREVVLFQTSRSKELHGTDFLSKELYGVKPAPELNIRSSARWLKGFKILVLGCLDRGSAGKISLAITDTLEIQMVYSALGLKIPIFSHSESLFREDCVYCGGDLLLLKSISGDYQDILKKMGIFLAPVDGLEKELEHFISGSQEGDNVPTLKGVITAGDVSKWEHKEFWVMKGTLLTPMARDVLREKNIAIIEK